MLQINVDSNSTDTVSLDIRKDNISYHKEDNSFSAMASSIGLSVGRWPKVITLFNSKTGKKRKFEVSKEQTVRGDLQYVTYECGNMSFQIFND